MERIAPRNIRTSYLLLHIVLWCICIQRSRQTDTLSNVDSAMPGESYHSGTSSSEVVCLVNRASNRYLRIRGRKDVDANGEIASENRLVIKTMSENVVLIKGEASNFYLCVTKKGEIVGRRSWVPKKSRSIMCQFLRAVRDNQAIELEPLQMTNMKVGFRRDGQKRNAKSVKPYTRYSQFGRDERCDTYVYNNPYNPNGPRSEQDENSADIRNNRVGSS